MKPNIFMTALCAIGFTFGMSTAYGATQQNGPLPDKVQTGWSTEVDGGAIYQFDTDLDEGGDYNATRAAIRATSRYQWQNDTSLGLSLEYGFDGYDFNGDRGFAARDPWSDIHSFSISTPLRWNMGKNWRGFFVPTVRSTGESGASFGDTITGGGFAGAAYRFGERLIIGPGIGVISKIEDSASVFPIIIVNWMITDRLSLETGGGLGATLGPGLSLHYQATDRWRLTLGGRYETLRFRLDEDGRVANGVGEDKSFPLFLGARYEKGPLALNLIGGFEFGGELRLEDANGNKITDQSYDTGAFLGFTFSYEL
jgi:hypothetical protein